MRKRIRAALLGLVMLAASGMAAPVFADDHGDTPATATTVAIGTITNGFLDAGGDVDYFRFTVPSYGVYVMFTRGSTKTVGRLYNSALQELTASAGTGEGGNFRIQYALNGGTYYVKVAASGSGSGAYAFHLEGPGAGTLSDDHGFSPWSATTVAVGSATDGLLDVSGDIDFFKFTVTSASTYVMFTRGVTPTVGRLHNSLLQELGSSVGSGENGNMRIESQLGAGTYYVRVNANSNINGAYTFHLEGPGGGTVSDDHGSSPWSATAVAVGSTTNGVLDVSGDVDYFRFVVGSSGTHVVYTTGNAATSGALYDSSLQQLDATVGGGTGTNFRIARQLDPGIYYVKVSGASDVAIAYAFHVDGPGGIAPVVYQGMWWNSPAESEPGWGVNLAHQGDTIFATWFTFGIDGKPWWLVVAAVKTAPGVYSGTLYTGTGPPFNSTVFDPAKVAGSPVGTATFTFADYNNASFAYTVNGTSQVKQITRQVFASPAPLCTWNAQQNPALAVNFQDMWWASPPGSESGWGINFAHQGNVIFATWFTFGFDGHPLWLVFAANRTKQNVYSGTVFTGTGPAFHIEPFDPGKVTSAPVGTATLTFADANNAEFDYTIYNVSQTKAITRQVFVAPGTVCQ